MTIQSVVKLGNHQLSKLFIKPLTLLLPYTLPCAYRGKNDETMVRQRVKQSYENIGANAASL